MSLSANVSSIEAIKRFKIAYCKLGEEARLALGIARQDVRKFVDWLETDQFNYWKSQIKYCQKMLAEAKSNLNRKKITASSERQLTEEKLAVRKAKERLEFAERKIKLIKKWSQVAGQAVTRYEGQSKQLASLLESDVPKAVALLDRMVDSLEKYTRTTSPAPAGYASSDGSAAPSEAQQDGDRKTDEATAESDSP